MPFAIALILVFLPFPALAQEYSTCFAYFDGRYVDLDFCQPPDDSETNGEAEAETNSDEEASETPAEDADSSEASAEEDN